MFYLNWHSESGIFGISSHPIPTCDVCVYVSVSPWQVFWFWGKIVFTKHLPRKYIIVVWFVCQVVSVMVWYPLIYFIRFWMKTTKLAPQLVEKIYRIKGTLTLGGGVQYLNFIVRWNYRHLYNRVLWVQRLLSGKNDNCVSALHVVNISLSAFYGHYIVCLHQNNILLNLWMFW